MSAVKKCGLTDVRMLDTGEYFCRKCGKHLGLGFRTLVQHESPGLSLKGLDAQCKKRKHKSSADCWCNPVIDYTDPETGISIYVHKEPQ